MYKNKQIAVVIPAYNEAPSIGKVVTELVALRDGDQQLVDDVFVCDNASSDGTAQVASDAGAHVVYEPNPGYGRACLKALSALPDCDAVVFVDGDYSVHTEELPLLLDKLFSGNDVVIGARRADLCQSGALTPHQILGNHFAAWLLRMRWRQTVTDLGPFRAVDVSALRRLEMSDPAFGWTMEMQAKALAMGMRMVEVPVHTRKRIGVSKVSGTWRGSIGATWGILSTFAKFALS